MREAKQKSNRLSPRGGLTLIEVMIAVVLFGIITAMAYPLFQPTASSRLDFVAQIVSGDLDYSRQLAVANNTQYTTTFDTAQDLYYLTHTGANPAFNALPTSPFHSSSDPVTRQTTKLSELPSLQGVDLYAVYTVNNAVRTVQTTVVFNSLGATISADPTEIWLAKGTGTTRLFVSVTVNPITGLTSVGSFTAQKPTP